MASVGRPTDYSEAILEKAREYLTNYESHGDVVPTIAGLAVMLGISRETVYAWAGDPEKSEFSDIVKSLMARQEQGLTQGGLRGDHNPTIAKLMLSKHGYADKQELTGAEGAPLSFSFVLDGPED